MRGTEHHPLPLPRADNEKKSQKECSKKLWKTPIISTRDLETKHLRRGDRIQARQGRQLPPSNSTRKTEAEEEEEEEEEEQEEDLDVLADLSR
uniref:Uncharacterized protein n=1 Tax=Chromera velia CCMP2878 TaxID=1169474 RepID=A0A0G4FZ14_9ALVE|eukprot:Cvel_19428.t1-p1 / transcript=Cvel_19428.t1 / gene=Cvel_19428 / organism=Chromera_velia_CCMP2878 / gene_product=hypothetical protein / transcript_product=hypothetical protein / location=Cvel_scaffold1673:32997-33272(+) / protein_length=92 / sequence_SO=supercontig / SO=protein_coding / is_pseudo=false